jgi:hypothetical protein
MPAIVRMLLLLFSVVACPAIAQKLEVQYDHEADFTRIRSYQWRAHRVFEQNPELKDVYSTGIQLVLEAGNAELMKRGLQPVESEPDIFVTFFILTKDVQRIKTTDITAWSGYYWYAAPTWTITELEQFVRGMLVIDIVDGRTLKLLWRATCGDEVKDMRKRDKKINAVVKKAFERFPTK